MQTKAGDRQGNTVCYMFKAQCFIKYPLPFLLSKHTEITNDVMKTYN